MKETGKKAQVTIEVEGWEAIAELTSEGLGIGYFPDYIARDRGDKIRPYSLPLQLPHYQISAFYPEKMRLRKSSEIFLAYF